MAVFNLDDERVSHLFVRDQLLTLSCKKSIGIGYSMIPCPWHNDTHPSGKVSHGALDKNPGRFSCYTCGHVANWVELADVLGLDSGGASDTAEDGFLPVVHLREHLVEAEKVDESKEPLVYPYTLKNAEAVGLAGGEWRGYSMRFLTRKIGARLCMMPDSGRHYVFLPVHIRDKLEGYIKAALVKPKEKRFPSYLNAPGPWSKTHGLFPFDPAIQLMRSLGFTSIVLVEGPRDALRLIRAGIPAMSILGTHSWTNNKMYLLEAAGVRRIVTMFDGDTAGEEASKIVKEGKMDGKFVIADPASTLFEVHTVKLWKIPVPKGHPEDKLDPGNVPDDILDSVFELLT